MKKRSIKYTSCMKLNGFPILPPVITPDYRKELLHYQQQAILIEKRLIAAAARCIDIHSSIPQKQTSLEHALAFIVSEDASKYVNRVPYTNLTCDIQVCQYTNNQFQVLLLDDEKSLISPKAQIDTNKSIDRIRRNSYTLDSPSPFLIEKLAKIDINDTSNTKNISTGNLITPPNKSTLDQVYLMDAIQGDSNQINEHMSVVNTEELRSNSKDLNLSSDTETELMNLSFHSSIESQLHSELTPTVDVFNIIDRSQELNKILTDIPKDYSDKLLSLLGCHDSNTDRIVEGRERWAGDVIVAWSRGYLVRRLRRSAHVRRLVDTIRAALVCAVQLHGETEDRIEAADVELHRRLIQQVSAACQDFHDVFFKLSKPEQMRIIQIDRISKIKQLAIEKRKNNSVGSAERPLTTHGRVMALASRRHQPATNRRLFPPLSTVIQTN